MNKAEEYKKLYEIHETYNKHDTDRICSCGKIFGSSDEIYNFIKERISNIDNKIEFIKYLIEIQPYYTDIILIEYLKLTDDYEGFKKLNGGKKVSSYDFPSKHINNIFKDNIFDPKRRYIYFEENWERFEYKKEYIQRYVMIETDINKILKTTPKYLWDKIKFSSNSLNLTIDEFAFENIDYLYKLLYKLKNVIYYEIDYNNFKRLIKDKRIFLASKIDFELCFNLFLAIYKRFPNEFNDYPHRYDKELADKLKFEKANSMNKIKIIFGTELYNVTIK